MVEIAPGWTMTKQEALELETRARSYLRLPDRMPQEELELLLSHVASEIMNYAPDAPASIREHALIRLAGYAYDHGTGEGGALRLSGALSLLFAYRARRARPVEAASDD